jgi:hypothetical protein
MLDIKRREFIALVGGGGLLLTAKARAAIRLLPWWLPVLTILNIGESGRRNAHPRG